MPDAREHLHAAIGGTTQEWRLRLQPRAATCRNTGLGEDRWSWLLAILTAVAYRQLEAALMSPRNLAVTPPKTAGPAVGPADSLGCKACLEPDWHSMTCDSTV